MLLHACVSLVLSCASICSKDNSFIVWFAVCLCVWLVRIFETDRCIPEWPDHLLTRSICWATLCLVRCVIVEKIVGGLSHVFMRLLKLFDSLTGGILLPGDDEPFMFCAVFAGVLADLVGHQSLTAWKGPNALRACVCCSNLNTKRSRAISGSEVSLLDHDERLFLEATDEEVFLIIDNIALLVEQGIGATQLSALETEVGFNHEPRGILADKAMRIKYNPTKHQLADWMHTFCQDGVASSEIAALLSCLSNRHEPPITNAMVQTFLEQCTLPKDEGKVEGKWVEPKRLRGGSLTAFSSMIVTLVPCIALLLRVYNVAEQLPEEVECFLMLDSIFGILTSGPRRSMQFLDRLQQLVIEHHRLFAKLYPRFVKPKLHHTHHIVSSMRHLGFLLACFVTERKHKMVNRFALHTFRNFEHTTLLDVLHQQCEYLSSGHDVFASELLLNPKTIDGYNGLTTSKAAVCHVGQVHSKDVVCTRGGVVAQVESCWKNEGGPVYVRAALLPCVEDDCTTRYVPSENMVLVGASEIVGVCVWCYIRPNIIKVRIPPTVVL